MFECDDGCGGSSSSISRISVTRFGEISPFWQNLQSLGQFFEGLFTIWENLGPTLANFVCHFGSFH